MFQSLFQPSPGCLTRIKVRHNNFPNCKSLAFGIWPLTTHNSFSCDCRQENNQHSCFHSTANLIAKPPIILSDITFCLTVLSVFIFMWSFRTYVDITTQLRGASRK